MEVGSGRPTKVGLLFGSFNPIHIGHLILAEHMATRTGLDEVWFVVSPQSPYKIGQELLPEAARLALVQAAISDNERLRVSDVEFHLPRPSYTIATLDELRQQHPAIAFTLLMGSDNLEGLAGWKDADRIQQEFDLYVYPRPGHPVSEQGLRSRVQVVSAPLLDISATFIRQSIQAGQSIRYLVPTVVESLIRQHRYWIT
ncbi:nicotinate-nucleotide adenylyltransferase [Microvirga sp. STR05]|uniref:Probable nicotinate-nucleotide adenylyltransferase n=1 Tax=Hymenobacter duratus TaxID=2771356 RepID=A0ABR8JFQ5_9BACT|nr:nicotinate (nicotinamide) nucleotide adenylyltransferase [Hymenobacter duratus]MBD2714406.1 nicotinate-nucleotide adenylyltransferase [Hymenobacter duratus]MBR7949309.1 nicotinate-nucleotide adenylyltransferase [Microvirga sp. STR05]